MYKTLKLACSYWTIVIQIQNNSVIRMLKVTCLLFSLQGKQALKLWFGTVCENITVLGVCSVAHNSLTNSDLFSGCLIPNLFIRWWSHLSYACLRGPKQEMSRGCNTCVTCGGNLAIIIFLSSALLILVSIYVLGDRQIIWAMVFLGQNLQNGWNKQQMFLFPTNLKS